MRESDIISFDEFKKRIITFNQLILQESRKVGLELIIEKVSDLHIEYKLFMGSNNFMDLIPKKIYWVWFDKKLGIAKWCEKR